MANLVGRDVRTTTGANLTFIGRTSGHSAWDTGSDKMKAAIEQSETVLVNDNDKWRIPFLNKLLGHRQELSYLGENIETISDQINSLCIN